MKEPTQSESNIDTWAHQVDQQIAKLRSTPATGSLKLKGTAPGEPSELPTAPAQQAVIERETGQPIATFWMRYREQARNDLCLPGGILHQQWAKWRELQSKDAVKMTLGALAGMGISTANVAPLAVAATVFLMNVVLKIGIAAVCVGCEQEGAPKTTGVQPLSVTPPKT
jgi:hypothetical protein